MSVPAFAWALERGRALNMPASERMLLIALADRVNGEGYCFPGQDTLADDTGLTARSVRELAPCLERRGLIRIERRGRLLYYHLIRPNGADTAAGEHRKLVPVSTSIAEAGSGFIPEASSGMEYQDTATPELTSAMTPEPASAVGERYRKLAYEIPEASSAKPFFNQVSKKERTPPTPPQAGGARRAAKSPRNCFHQIGREFDAEMEQRSMTIEGTADDVLEFNRFYQQRRIGGSHG